MLILPAKTLFLARRPALVAAAGITFVGSASDNVINGGTTVLDVSGLGLAQNDILLVFNVSSAGTPAAPSGYTSVNGSTSVYYKIQTSTPDTSVSFWDSGGNGDAAAALGIAFRGVSTTTPLDVTSTTSTSIDPPSITPASNDCCILVFTLSAVVDGSPGTISGYAHPTPHTITADDSAADITVAMGYRILTGGAGVPENPAAWSDLSSNLPGSRTIALRPA